MPGFRCSTRGDQLKILTESVVHSYHGCTSAGLDGATDGGTGDTGSVSDINKLLLLLFLLLASWSHLVRNRAWRMYDSK